jgi:carbon-monoxide dehydrogenase medium subunit
MLPRFKILNTNSVSDAVGELARRGDQAKVYGGGTELLILLRHNLLRTEYLLNIKPIVELGEIRGNDKTVRIGASVTHRRLETDATVRATLPMLADAESQVANIRVRGQGTIGGNLCFNDPHSDPATALLVYDASVTVEGPAGARQMPLRQFLRGMYATALEADELLVSIDVPCLPAEFGSSYMRIHRLQRPTLTVAAAASRRNGAIEDVRLAVGCVGPTALRLTELEAKLRGGDPNDSGRIIREAKIYLEKTLQPIDDLLGSAEYKTYIAGVLLERALAQALRSVDKKQDGKNG